MKKIFGKNTLLHIAVIAIFMTITLAYFYPLLEGKDLVQGDVVNADGMSKELKDYHKATGEYAFWTNSMFGGMPSYQIFGPTAPNIYFYIGQIVQKPFPYFTYAIILMALICFYIMLSTLGFSHTLAAIGAFAFAYGSYNVIIIEAGHITKAYAIAMMPLVIAGFIQTYRGKYLFGGLLTAIGLGMNISQNHVQITYYIGLTLGIFVVSEFIFNLKEKTFAKFTKASATIAIAVILAVIPNLFDLYMTYDYGKESTRSKSELTTVSSNTTGGLDKDYAFMWSYGKMETFSLLIPNFYGGSSHSELSKSSNLYAAFKSNGIPEQQARDYVRSAPTYWGDQPFTSGPVYVGAIICFLFVLGLLIVPGRNKWWLLAVTILGIILSWGKNYPMLNDLFFNYLPGYNKFRTVSMSLIISCFSMAMLAILALKEVLENKLPLEKIQKSLIIALASTAGVSLFFLLFGGSIFSYSTPNDAQMLNQGMPQWFIDAIISDRASMFRTDALRTIIYILVAFGAIWMFLKNKLSKTVTLSVLIAAMILDLWLVDTRYLNGSDFKPKRAVVNAIPVSDVDMAIKQDQDLSYRVFNVAGNPFNDSRTSFYHKSIGGYHGAKLRRYQEVVDAQFSKNMNVKILNMLNTKYFLAPTADGSDVQIQRNVAALGNAWFIDTLKVVENADAEMASLKAFEPATTAILNKEFSPMTTAWKMGKDSTSTIKLIEYKPDFLKYEVSAQKTELAVFSEIYYPKYWNVTIDGKKADHFRVNYILRAMVVPQGKHVIEFKFTPQPWLTAKTIALWGSILMGFLIALYIGWTIRKSIKTK